MTTPPTSTWIFLRHGESTANAAGTLSGWEDVALTAHGQDQARGAGPQLAGYRIERVLSSDLQRARVTAELALSGWQVATRMSPPPVETHRDLRERDLGEWQGARLAALRARGEHHRLLGWDTRPPGGEGHLDIALRVVGLLARVEAEPAGCTLVVAHGGVIRTLVGLLDETPRGEIGKQKVPNALPIVRAVAQGRWAALLRSL